MRLNLYWRGIDLIDIELHLFRPRADEDQPEVPVIQAAAHPVDVSRAEPMEPDTMAFGFGLR